MITTQLEFYSPHTIEEAKDLLSKFAGEIKILAGGQSLLPLMNLGIISPTRILDISRLRNLTEIKEERDRIEVGALATHHTIETSTIIKTHCDVLVDAASHIGDVQVRNRGTIGGAVCHADPAQDYPPVLIASEARVVLESSNGNRIVNARDFFVGTFTTDARATELVTKILIPKTTSLSAASYQKLEFISGGFAIANAAVNLAVDKLGLCRRILVSIGGVESSLISLTLEKEIEGKRPDQIIDKVGNTAYESVSAPLSDIQADGEYRREMSRVLTRRALKASWAKLEGRSK